MWTSSAFWERNGGFALIEKCCMHRCVRIHTQSVSTSFCVGMGDTILNNTCFRYFYSHAARGHAERSCRNADCAAGCA